MTGGELVESVRAPFRRRNIDSVGFVVVGRTVADVLELPERGFGAPNIDVTGDYHGIGTC